MPLLRQRLAAAVVTTLVAGLAFLGPRPVAAAGPAASDDASAPKGPVRRFALVVGSNHTLDDSQAPLRFADDDAARMTELLTETGVDTELVTHLDRDSQALFPELVSRAHRPDEAGLQAAYESLLTRMKAAKERGDEVELLVYYSGHGDVGPDGQGYLTLEEGKLTRKKLFAGLLARSPADHNHVIIDACRSEQFVLSRGKDWQPDRSEVDLSRAVEKYLDKTHLGHFPNTGVVLAHSADQQTHEWDRYRGGIFTHELLSGLRGGADLNGDARIEYSELGAFVSAANHGVDDPRARLEVVVRPPADDERRALVEHGRLADQRLLLFGPGDRYHYTVEDGRGVRLADLHRSGEQPGYLRLPDGELFIHRASSPDDRDEAQIASDQRGVVLAHLLRFQAAPSASRGSLDQAFRRGLFATPFGPGYYAGYTAQRGLLGISEPDWQGPTTGTTPSDGDEPAVIADGGSTLGDDPGSGQDRVTRIETPDGNVVVIEQTGDEHEEGKDDDDDDEGLITRLADERSTSRAWGGIFLGVPISPFPPGGPLPTTSRRITANDMEACFYPREGKGCAQVRGLDLRWQLFSVKRRARFPRSMGYFRSGYEAGRVAFDRDGGLQVGDARALSYVAVPLYLGGNLYLFDEFPLRPYAGLGFGLDVIRLDYDRVSAARLMDTVARPGFELHAGLEVRITNYVSLTAEVKQQWSARKKLEGVPDLANEGVSLITGVAIGFPLRPSR
ncbi:MAG: caspase family protein [Myxococcales bacterium]|nr:caspase family protein [Myxococcales bacterium]